MESTADPLEYIDALRLLVSCHVIADSANAHFTPTRYVALRESRTAPFGRDLEDSAKIAVIACL